MFLPCSLAHDWVMSLWATDSDRCLARTRNGVAVWPPSSAPTSSALIAAGCRRWRCWDTSLQGPLRRQRLDGLGHPMPRASPRGAERCRRWHRVRGRCGRLRVAARRRRGDDVAGACKLGHLSFGDSTSRSPLDGAHGGDAVDGVGLEGLVAGPPGAGSLHTCQFWLGGAEPGQGFVDVGSNRASTPTRWLTRSALLLPSASGSAQLWFGRHARREPYAQQRLRRTRR